MADKKAVFYYSLEGNTRRVANAIAEKNNADIIEIKPANDISSEGFSKFFWAGRQVMMRKKPELKKLSKSPKNYDVLYIGTPVWAGTFTPALRSFFDKYKIQGKEIIVFCTHQGGPGKCLDKMAKKLEGNEITIKIDFHNVMKMKDEELKKIINEFI